MKYRPDIDGLRAVAVLPVLFFHAHIGCPGGFVGVDVFFVISGYLITGLILRDLDAGEFHILTFWERRIRRILPPLAAVVLATLIACWFQFLPADFMRVGQSAVAQAMLVSNLFFWKGAGYFMPGEDARPLLHTWSLAVEEQFYLLFPFLLIAVSRLSRKSLVPLVVLGAAISFATGVYGSYHHPSATFFLLPTRAWELLIGAFLAAIPMRHASLRWLNEFLSCCGLLAIAYAVFFYNADTRFPGLAALLPAVGTALVIWANAPVLTFGGKILSLRPVVFLGLISYSLYLWHWPVLVIAKYWSPDNLPATYGLMLLTGSFLLAVFSWRFIERPFRTRLWFKTRIQIFSFAFTSTITLILAGLAIYLMQGFPSRIPAQARQYSEARNDHPHVNQVSLNDAEQERFIELGAGDPRQPPRLFLWGDSHAMALIPLLDSQCKAHSIRGVAAAYTGTAPLVDYESSSLYSLHDDSIAYGNTVVAFIRAKHIEDVLLIANWDSYDDGSDRLQQAVAATLQALKTTTAKIWIMKTVPKYHVKIPKALAGTIIFGGAPQDLGLTMEEHRTASQRMNSILTPFAGPNVTLLDPAALLLGHAGRYLVEANGVVLYSDGNHLSTHGATLLRPLFTPVFADIDNKQLSSRIDAGTK